MGRPPMSVPSAEMTDARLVPLASPSSATMPVDSLQMIPKLLQPSYDSPTATVPSADNS